MAGSLESTKRSSGSSASALSGGRTGQKRKKENDDQILWAWKYGKGNHQRMLAKEVVKPSMLSGFCQNERNREAVQKKKYGIAYYEENRQVPGKRIYCSCGEASDDGDSDREIAGT